MKSYSVDSLFCLASSTQHTYFETHSYCCLNVVLSFLFLNRIEHSYFEIHFVTYM